MKDSILPGLKPIREKLGLSQQKLGSEAKSSGEAISNIENGARGASLALVKRLASVLCCSADDLLSECPPLTQIEIAYRRHQLEQLEAQDKKAGAA